MAIDKARGLFVTVGVALPNDDEDKSEDEGSNGEEDDDDGEGEVAEGAKRDSQTLQSERDDTNRDQLQTLGDQVEKLGISDAETVEPPSFDKILGEPMQDTSYRQTLFDSHSIDNDLRGVAFLLETYKDDPFISWRNKEGGNCVSLAATEGHDMMIQFLHTKGGDLNNTDNRGRTPLMEAALWGRLKAVNYLLEHGADPRAKDRKGRGAYFYSRPSRRTARMREKFSHYPESGEAETNRRIIAIKLQIFEPIIATEETVSSSSSNEPKRGHFVMETTDWSIQIGFYEQSIAYNVPDWNKTVARLDRGMLFPVVSAASGWRTDFAVEHILDNRLWRDHVFELCQLIGYALPEDDYDEPRWPGSFNASHAEKKLMAYYINQHVILPSALFGAGAGDQPEKWVQQDLRLQHLATLCPRVPTVQASIRVSRAICSDSTVSSNFPGYTEKRRAAGSEVKIKCFHEEPPTKAMGGKEIEPLVFKLCESTDIAGIPAKYAGIRKFTSEYDRGHIAVSDFLETLI
ncbi:hypothetical protein Sste5346_000150 [Sporothrix stenoceras]|uniref:Single-strand DNA deaminase toxin A-like C-terminal domain-containing protein n=1 Tax=Sporothrix stenoceras TaxID=5173 RepID=A0ABR3ZTU8_9PEZI